MQPAIPAHEYSADERAERARAAGLVFVIVAAAAILVPVAAILIFVFSR